MHLQFKGKPPIRLAESVKEVLIGAHPYAKAILDRKTPVDEALVGAVMAQTVFSWKDRTPLAALDENGDFIGMDLDLFSFLVPMAARSAIIELPEYRNRRQVVRKASERRDGQARFGKMTGLISHKDVFSFSARIWDESVMVQNAASGQERAGAHRNYMLVDIDGTWHDGWKNVQWDPSAEENAFLKRNKIFNGNTIAFTHYVHPNRWQSLFGAPYFLLKMLHARLGEEGKFYRDEVKRLERLGIEVPPGEKAPYEKPESTGEKKNITVETLEVDLIMPPFSGSYSPVSDTIEGVRQAYRRQKLLTYSLRPQMQFAMRADEAAYFLYGKGRIAHWIARKTWKEDRMDCGRYGPWSRLDLAPKTALRWRLRPITQTVAA
ncbi:MAG: hypothetical protein Q8Q39_03180 [bacterium]|nr:hypothetical protein [bacterium]